MTREQMIDAAIRRVEGTGTAARHTRADYCALLANLLWLSAFRDEPKVVGLYRAEFRRIVAD